ncbi:hypothetical protein N7486_009129 [Penicillium sp. IBT 16267x]|nr:hypothetical protein N7486_009129 [Penicillium sp. IBT 16267x]
MSKTLPEEHFLPLTDEHALEKNKSDEASKSDNIPITLDEADWEDSMIPFCAERYQKLGNHSILHNELDTDSILAEDEIEALAESQILDGLM